MPLALSALMFGALLSTSAMACPDLRGFYRCVYSGDSGQESEIIIEYRQDVRGGTTHYSESGNELVADNRERALEELPNFRRPTLRAWCDQDVLRSEYKGQVFLDGSYYGDLSLTMSLTLDQDRHLVRRSRSVFQDQDGITTNDAEIHCPRVLYQ